MALAFDTSGQLNSNTSSVSSLSGSITIGASLTNGAIVVSLAVSSSSQITSPSVTLGGVPLTLIGSTTVPFDVGTGSLMLFGLVNPPGGTNTLAASWTNAGTVVLGFASFSGVDQTGGATTFLHGNTLDVSGGATTSSISITTASGNATVCMWSCGAAFSGTQTPTADWQVTTVGNVISECQHVLSISGSTTYTAVIGSSDVMTAAGCDLLSATPGSITGRLATTEAPDIAAFTATSVYVGPSGYILNENGTDRFLLESGTGLLLLEGVSGSTTVSYNPWPQLGPILAQ